MIYTVLKGLLLAALGHHAEAESSFEQAFGLDPDNSVHYFNRALYYIQKGRYDKAIDDLSKVIQKNGKDRVAYLKRAICYQEKINPNLVQAREDFKLAEKMEPDTKYRRSHSSFS